MNARPSGSQSVERAAELLVRIIEAPQPPSVGELAEAAALPKSTTSRLLRALELHGLVQRDGVRGSLRPGFALMRFARRTGTGADLVALAEEALDRLSERTGETINLAVPGPTGVEHLAQRDSRFFIGSTNWVGSSVPFHAAANGKVFLAFGAARLPRGPLERFTPQTIVDRRRLETELAEVRARGWAVASEELEPGLLAVAAPVYDERGEVVAAISLSAPTLRVAPEAVGTLGVLVARAAAEASTRLGRGGETRGAA